MDHRRLLGTLSMVAALVAVLVGITACEAGFSTANISDAWMSADEAGEQRVTTYATDAVFYAQVDVSNAPDDTALKASWIAVEVEGADPGLVIDEVETTVGSGVSYFTLTNDGPWPVGSYKVDIYLNGELDKTLEFSVQ